jgi:hypothetical protein
MADNEIEITVDVDKVDADPVTSAFRAIDEAAKKTGEEVERSVGRARDAMGRFVKGSGGNSSPFRKVADDASFLDKVVNLAGNGLSFFGKALSEADGTVGDFSKKLLSAGASAAFTEVATTAATGGVNILVGALVAAAGAIPLLVGGFLALAPALLAAGGAAGAAASALAGLIGVGLTLKLGLGGVSEAWTAYGKQAAAGGSSSAAAGKQAEAAARQVEQAEYSLTLAKRQAKQASEDVTRARENEIERLEDLNLAIRGQAFAQADATKALQDAKDKRAALNATGNESEKKLADEAVARAQYQYDVESERTEDLRKEKEKANKDGIDGSDQVKAALERQRDANERLTQAASALADAQKHVGESAGGAAGGINQFDAAMAKLSPNAQKFVLAMIDISKKMDVVKRKVQDRLFDGLDVSLRDLSEKWLPRLPGMLGGVADSLNVVAKKAGKALGDKDFMDGIGTAVAAFSKVLKEDISPAIDHVIHAFGVLAGGSTKPLETIGGWIERISEKFDNWVTSASKSGALQTFMTKAADTLQTIWEIGGKVFAIMGKITKILFPGSEKSGGGVLDSVSENLTKISSWLDKKDNQKKVQDWIDKFVDLIGNVITLTGKISDLFDTWIKVQRPVYKAIDTLGDTFHDTYKFIVKKGGDLVDWFRGLPKKMTHAVSGLWNGIKDGFRSALNWVVDRWNSLSFTLPRVSFLGMDFGGSTVGVPPISHFASGGASSGGWAMTGERGRELMRLPAGASVMSHGDTERALAGNGGQESGGVGVIKFDPSGWPKLIAALMEALRIEIKAQGGNVQRTLGVVGA